MRRTLCQERMFRVGRYNELRISGNAQQQFLLITGGTGSFGKALTRRVLEKYPDINRLVIFWDELKQYEMAQEFRLRSIKHQVLRGDVRNERRRALERIDYCPCGGPQAGAAAEYNPIEFIQTNVMGAQNMISACMDTDVRGVVALSTDKAAAPINLMEPPSLLRQTLHRR